MKDEDDNSQPKNFNVKIPRGYSTITEKDEHELSLTNVNFKVKNTK